ncbi:sushi, von Willebrand factor type A, EGF and pentraxin domain-containing protein 1-like [Haliotis rufescens]|uniref:sushi, von Willebrand factor type A, EGF and pentraxin domain-containing protein 1-like n=1 Tax=Haliotis rufescens TaxID=6454 RepID=UPI00201EC57A|nr:sushi, von Willebrand factor type A, EGF and pentraxin domain-containing protein 1-like [Haliotis rufescens]
MAARYWLGVVICFAVVSENNCQRTCSLTAGRLPISVKYCMDAVGHQIPVNQHSSLASRSTCTVTCLEDAKLRFLVCDDGIWHMTPNLCKGQTDVQVLPKRRTKRWWWVPIAIIFISWGTRQGPPPDRSPPVVTCPVDIHTFSDPIQTSTKVYWNDDDASAYDSKDGAVAAKRASRKRSGYLFGEGRTSITYTARDRAGNMGSCVMTVTVTTIRCSPGPNKTFKNGYYVCHPSADFVYGTNCNYGCYYGYKIKGSKHRECKQNGHWSTTVEPACETVTCPPPSFAPDATLTCTDGTNFKSACSYMCKAGYDVKPGMSRVRVCAYDGQWRGAIPECVDSEPPKFTNCPSVKTYFTERSSSLALVDWDVPAVTDNSRESITPRQTSGISNTDYHPVGVYEIIYTAADSAGNKARECKFKVVVKELKCFAQYPLPYMRVDCPEGYRHGSTCSFSCTGNYVLEGAKATTCELANSDNGLAYPYWEMSSQPSCSFFNTCRELSPPTNGALACDLWEDGNFCQMQCMKGTDLTRSTAHFGQLMVCGESGDWKIGPLPIQELPACTNSRRPTDTIMSVLFYYDGPCTEEAAQNQIKTNFLNAFKESPFSETLGQSGRTIANVKVTCGSSDNGRRKRETRVTVKVDILLAIDGDVSRETFKDAEKTLLNLYNHITEDIKGDNSKLFQHLDQEVRSVMEIERPTIELDCPLDTFPSYNTYSCVGCGEGLYHSEGDNSCKECPVGTYQPEAEGRGCIQCPDGRTTLQNKTTTVDRCLPMCQLGYFSENGVEPCTPCSQGQYADNVGSTECTACSDVMTTVSQGSASVTSCRHFDVAMSSSQNASVQLEVARKDFDIQSGFELRFWLVYHSAGDVISLTSGDKHTSIMSISMTTTSELQLRVKGTVLDVAALNTSRWYQININYINSTLSISIDEVQSLTHAVTFDANDGQSILVSMGGAGFEGSVSQVNMWRSPQTVPSLTSHTCFTGSLGDVFNWKDFTSANLSDSFIQIPSECDDTDECLSSPCIHGDCNDDLNGYTCSCEDGYHGDNCDVNMDDCLENECTNGGTCVDGVAEYTCRCTPEYTGQYCDANLVHGHWTAWGNWTECSTSCGSGERTRARRCDNPQPQNGGDDCEGSETEVGACDTGECPECSKVSPPEHGDLECTDVNSTRLCQLKCEDGYDFDRSPLSVYKCGLETGYEWSYVTEDNPQGRFPNCIAIEEPDELEIKFEEEYEDLECIDDNEADRKSKVLLRAREETQSLPCIKDNTCYIKDIRTSTCDAEQRKKREITHMGFIITLGTSPAQKGLQSSLEGLNSALLQLNSSAIAGDFTVRIDGVDYLLTGAPVVSGSITCSVGWTRVDFYCIPCGPGTFYINGYCERCDIGRYGNVTGATFCHACPKGKSTPGRSSLSIEECTVDVHLPKDFPLAFVVGVTASFLLITAVSVAAYFYRKWYQKRKVNALETVGEDMSTGRQSKSSNVRFKPGAPNPAIKVAWIQIDYPNDLSKGDSFCLATQVGTITTEAPPPYSQSSVPLTQKRSNTRSGHHQGGSPAMDIDTDGAQVLGTDTGRSERDKASRTSQLSIQHVDMNFDRKNSVSVPVFDINSDTKY